MEIYLNRTFSWPNKTYQSFDISSYQSEYLVTICSPESIGSIIIRWASGWWSMWKVKEWLIVHQILSDIVQSREPKQRKQLNRLPDKPIVLFHEHEFPEDWTSSIIFQKSIINHVPVLLVRYVTYIDEILNKDIIITLCNPQGELQWDWVDDNKCEEEINPVFLSNNDLDEVSRLLLAIFRVQKRNYQERVDDLLSILPSYESK